MIKNLGLSFVWVLFFSACKLPLGKVPVRSWDEQKRQLKAELDSLQTDFEKTSRLRQFVAQNVDLGDNAINCSKQGIEMSNLSAKEFYDYFAQDGMTVYCGGASYYLLRVLQDFGYDSYAYDVGDKETFATHQFNLVEVQDGGEYKLVVQDAYFDHSIVYPDTERPIDFLKVIDFLEHNQLDSVSLKKTYSVGNTLSRTENAYGHWQVSKKNGVNVFKSANKDVPYLIRSTRSIDTFLDSKNLQARYCDFLRFNGHECDLRYLLLYPVGGSVGVLSKTKKKEY